MGKGKSIKGGLKRNFWILLIALSFLGWGGFGIVEASASEKGACRFGIMLPQTGKYALYGADQTQAALWAVEDINLTGGVNGRQMEAVSLDTQGDPKLGITMAERLVSMEKVPVWLVGWSTVVGAVGPIANRNNVLSVSVGANSPRIATLGDYTYTSYPLANVDITAIATYSYKNLGKRRAAIIYIHNDTGLYAARVYREVFEDLGGEVVSYQSYDPGSTDYTGQLLQIRKSNPDIIHIQGDVPDMPLVIAQMRQLGIQQDITSYSGAYNQKLLEQTGKGAEGLTVTSLAPTPKLNPAVIPFVARWQREKKRQPYGLPYTQYMHDAVYILRDCFAWLDSKNMPFTGENMRNALLAVKSFKSPLVGLTVINEDHTARTPVYLLKVIDGEFKHIDTLQ